MFTVFKNAWQVKDIRQRIIFVIFILAVYRLGTHIPLPGIDHAALTYAKTNGQEQTLYSMLASGGYGTIFALGIGPYISASIIMQLLTVAIPRLEAIQKEGEEGRKKIGQYTKVLALVLATLQASGTVYSLQSLFKHNSPLVYIMATVSMVTGTIFIMWLGDLITEKKIGNGSSFIIFSNIISGLPVAAITLYNQATQGGIMGFVKVLVLLVVFVFIIAFVVLVQDGERRIPVQYAKTGRTKVGGNTSYIPMKVNIAGVMSIIFAISLLQFPMMLNQLFQNETLTKVSEFLDMNEPTGAIIYIVLIFLFTFFYTSFTFNPTEIAENMKKNASFIPSIRPGKPTADYIQGTVDRLSWIGATFYALIAVTPILLQAILKIPVGFGGTTLLIVTGVCLDLVKQLESQLLVRHYKGFLS